ncbi:MAG: type II toxin-antitoxin system HipA family toxin [Verrucomicrobiota bacterium]
MTSAAILLYGTTVGAVSWDATRRLAYFEYDPGFISSGIEISPLHLPLRPGVFSFPDLNRRTFQGLPGLLSDALPGMPENLLIEKWQSQNEPPAVLPDPVERLISLGPRAIGALKFHPSRSPNHPAERLDLATLVPWARESVSSHDSRENGSAAPPSLPVAMSLRASSTAGAVRATALISWHPESGEMWSPGTDLPTGCEPWLLKFDGGDRNLESSDPAGRGRLELAYHLMARAAGIQVGAGRLLEGRGRAHFMTRRFDRLPGGGKVHLQSLSALAHVDFQELGSCSYEQAFQVARQLRLPHPDLTELFRRAVFNLVARNQDDHPKNIAFLMDPHGTWRLAPAFNLTYVHNLWTNRHQMSLAGKRDGFTPADLHTAGLAASLKPRQIKAVLDQVKQAVTAWPTFAETAGVPAPVIPSLRSGLRLHLIP